MIGTLRRFGGWIGKQVDGFVGGVVRLASTPPKAWLPAGVWGTIMWVVRSATWSVGTSTPVKQITASFALGMFALLTSWITLGATLALVVFFAATMLVGFARLFPAFNSAFVGFRDTLIPRG